MIIARPEKKNMATWNQGNGGNGNFLKTSNANIFIHISCKRISKNVDVHCVVLPLPEIMATGVELNSLFVSVCGMMNIKMSPRLNHKLESFALHQDGVSSGIHWSSNHIVRLYLRSPHLQHEISGSLHLRT